MEAILLRMLSLLRRTHIYYINRTILLHVGPLPTEAIVTPTGSQPRRQYLPCRQVLPRRQDLPNRGFLPNCKSPDLTSQTPESTWHGSYWPCWDSPGYSRDMWLHVYPERVGIPELERGCHSSLGSSGDISIPHWGVSRGHQNVPIHSANHYTTMPDSSGLRGLLNWSPHWLDPPLLTGPTSSSDILNGAAPAHLQTILSYGCTFYTTTQYRIRFPTRCTSSTYEYHFNMNFEHTH